MRLPVPLRATLAAAAAALLVMFTPAAPAWAHAKLVKSDPANGATVSAPVAGITLTFSEMVKQQFSTVVVTGADGVSHSDGTPKSVDKTLTQPVGTLPPGTIKVAWRTVSADGHPIEGQFTFTNAAPAPTSAAASSAAPSSPPPTTATTVPSGAATERTSDNNSSDGLVWAVAGGALVLLLLIGGVFWWRRRTPA